jgi:hypothetical protein
MRIDETSLVDIHIYVANTVIVNDLPLNAHFYLPLLNASSLFFRKSAQPPLLLIFATILPYVNTQLYDYLAILSIRFCCFAQFSN